MKVNIAYLGPENSIFQDLAPDGVEIKWVDNNIPIDQQAKQLEGVLAVIVVPSAFPVELAKLTPSIQLVQTTSAGTNMIDKISLGELGIKVANNGGGNAIAVAEHTISLLVSTYRKFQLQFNSVKEGKWSGNIRSDWFEQAHEIAGKTIGIVGLGRIGTRIAKRLQGWECDLVYTDIVQADHGIENQLNLKRLPLNNLLQQSDVITLHVPLNTSTHHMIGDTEFNIMKPSAVLINACRGPVVDELALIRAIQNGKISAAGLDVTEDEPTAIDNPLLSFDNVLITPHLAAFAQESTARSRAFAVYNANRIASGKEPESIVLPDDTGEELDSIIMPPELK
jgi:glyoxylate reductase/D-3-phosphoglycerate dehydrogenase